MGTIDLLRNQHSEILSIIKNIEMLTMQNMKNNAKDIALNISTLSGKLKMHLLTEDQILYPALMKNESKEISNMARRFHTEMGGLADAFGRFVQKYNTPSRILQNYGTFAMDSKNVFQQIINRIHREDSQLYPLCER